MVRHKSCAEVLVQIVIFVDMQKIFCKLVNTGNLAIRVKRNDPCWYIL